MDYRQEMFISNPMFTNSSTFQLPSFLATTIGCIKRGSNLIVNDDLKHLHGNGNTSEEKWLTNFVIDGHLELLKHASAGMQVEVIPGRNLKKGVGIVPAQQVLKGNNYYILNQDLVLIPCNVGNSHHWFLMAVQPPLLRVVVIDSMPGSFIKPTVNKAIERFVKLLKEVDGNLKSEEWSFYANKLGDIPSQTNDYDCGIFACMYARGLVNVSPMIAPPFSAFLM